MNRSEAKALVKKLKEAASPAGSLLIDKAKEKIAGP